MAKKTDKIEVGTGDVFKDLGFADADERKLRTQLALRVNDLIKEFKLTQTAAANIFGIPQPHVSDLRNYKLSRFSSERLLHFITQLDRDVEIVIRPKAANHVAGLVSVLVAA
jgi:predicted XRE-type DNA-binding protein